MLTKVKQALRISSSAFDLELTGLISTARADLKLAGISHAKTNANNDPLIEQAIITYCKTHFGYDNPDAERLLLSYNSLKTHLCLSEEYTSNEELEQEGESDVLA